MKVIQFKQLLALCASDKKIQSAVKTFRGQLGDKSPDFDIYNSVNLSSVTDSGIGKELTGGFNIASLLSKPALLVAFGKYQMGIKKQLELVEGSFTSAQGVQFLIAISLVGIRRLESILDPKSEVFQEEFATTKDMMQSEIDSDFIMLSMFSIIKSELPSLHDTLQSALAVKGLGGIGSFQLPKF